MEELVKKKFFTNLTKKYFVISVFIIVSFLPSKVYSLVYVGVGADYIVPIAKLSDVNLETFGFNVQIESRKLCKLWYGLRFDYFALDRKMPVKENYYETMVLISPKVRYKFLPDNCNDYTGKIAPYVQGMLTISSIKGTDNKNLMGLGGGAGGGIVMGFQMFKTCMMFDFNALYSAPNFILRAKNRASLQFINVGLTLSVGL